MFLSLCSLALLAAGAAQAPDSDARIVPFSMWPDDKVIAATTPQAVQEASFTVDGGTVVDVLVPARLWRPGFGALIELNAPVTASLDEGTLTLPAGSRLFVSVGTVLVQAPGARLNGHRLQPAFRLRAERVGLGKNGSPAGRLDHAIWLDPVEVAGWSVDELDREQRTMVLAKPHVYRSVTLPAGTTVTNLLGMGTILSARLPVSRNGVVVEHRWVRRPPLELHLQVSHRPEFDPTTPATLAVTVSGKTTTRQGVMRQGSFHWTARKTASSSGVEEPQAFSLHFAEGFPLLAVTGALPGSDECRILNWTDRGDVECHVDDGRSLVPTGTPPVSFAAALIARLQAP